MMILIHFRTRDLELNNQEYASQMLHFGDHFYDPTAALVSAEFKVRLVLVVQHVLNVQPTEEAKDRLAQEVERQKAKRYAMMFDSQFTMLQKNVLKKTDAC